MLRAVLGGCRAAPFESLTELHPAQIGTLLQLASLDEQHGDPFVLGGASILAGGPRAAREALQALRDGWDSV